VETGELKYEYNGISCFYASFTLMRLKLIKVKFVVQLLYLVLKMCDCAVYEKLLMERIGMYDLLC
jgi:hypothetical protein